VRYLAQNAENYAFCVTTLACRLIISHLVPKARAA